MPAQHPALDPDALNDLTRTRRLVYHELALADGWLTVSKLADRTGYTTSCMRSAARDLIDMDLVERRPDLENPRRYEYRLAEDPVES